MPGFDGVLCLPGTHSKWVHLSAGEVVSFQTFMTGEMFALLSEQSVLRHGMAGEGWDEAAFDEGVSDALSRPERIGARLFALRAEGLMSGLVPAAARARLSGLLIGHGTGRRAALLAGSAGGAGRGREAVGAYARALGGAGRRRRGRLPRATPCSPD